MTGESDKRCRMTLIGMDLVVKFNLMRIEDISKMYKRISHVKGINYKLDHWASQF